MKKILVSLLGFLLIFSMSCLAQVVKCEDEHGRTTFSDKPCSDNQKSTEVEIEYEKIIKDASDDQYHTVISGKIVEPKGPINIKDVVAKKSIKGNDVVIRLDLYSFLLTEKEYKIALGGLVGRGAKHPRQLSFRFSGDKILFFTKENISRISYFEYGADDANNDTGIEKIKFRGIIKHVRLYKKNDQIYFNFKMQGNSKNHYWDLNINTVLHEHKSSSIKMAELKKRNNIQDDVSYSIEGIVVYNDVPIDTITSLDAKFSVKEMKTKKYVKGYDLKYDKKTSQYVISNLPPSNYNIIVEYTQDKSKGVATNPGDYFSHNNFTLDSDLTDKEIRLNAVIHIVKPIDNLVDQPNPYNSKPFSSPITFVWDPIMEGARYNYKIRPISDESEASMEKLSSTTKETHVTFNLPKGRYLFELQANDSKNERIGYLIVHGKSWSASDYIFSIK